MVLIAQAATRLRPVRVSIWTSKGAAGRAVSVTTS